MRRGLARLLLLVFSFGLIAPALFAGRNDGELRVPACCRKDGKHKCAMGTGESSSTSSGVASGRVQCPMYREIKSPPATDAYGLSVLLFPYSHDLPVVAESATDSSSSAISSIEDSHSQRGPPFALVPLL